MISNADKIKFNLDIAERMIDYISRKIHNDNTTIGMLNSAYEYETFFGTKADDEKLAELKRNVEALGILTKYRSDLMDYAAGISSTEPSLDLSSIENFAF